MTTHARLSPSSAHRWLECPYSIQLEEHLRETGEFIESTSDAAEEGTAAHEEAALHLDSFGSGDDLPLLKYEIQPYLDFCISLMRIDTTECTESRVRITPHCFGTADFVSIDRDGQIHVVDLKYGKGIKVYAANNPQLMLYALGVFNKYPDAKGFKSTIVQPRLDHIDTVDLTITELNKLQHRVFEIEKLLDTPQQPYVGDHCRFCPVKSHCVGFLNKTRQVVAAQFDNIPVIDTLTPKQLTHVLDHKESITSFMKACEQRAYELVKKGERLPGYKMGEGRTNRKWKLEAEDMLSLTCEMPATMWTEPELISPAEAEKVLGKEKYKELCAPLVDVSRSAKLVKCAETVTYFIEEGE